jgi:hypothetical protein
LGVAVASVFLRPLGSTYFAARLIQTCRMRIIAIEKTVTTIAPIPLGLQRVDATGGPPPHKFNRYRTRLKQM